MSFLTYLESIDHSIFLDMNQDFINPVFDVIFPGFRVLTYVFWLFLIIYFWAKNEKKLALLMSVGIFAGALFTYPIKFLIDRTRPYDQIASTRLLTPSESDPSFPSGHTEMSFLAATIVSRFHPEYSKYLYAFSFMVALSRIYVGVHFPADAIGGIIVGVIIGRLMLIVAKKKKDIFWQGEI